MELSRDCSLTLWSLMLVLLRINKVESSLSSGGLKSAEGSVYLLDFNLNFFLSLYSFID